MPGAKKKEKGAMAKVIALREKKKKGMKGGQEKRVGR